jgi:hypothetical protein
MVGGTWGDDRYEGENSISVTLAALLLPYFLATFGRTLWRRLLAFLGLGLLAGGS